MIRPLWKMTSRNLRHRRVRTGFLITFILILTAAVFLCVVLAGSMEENIGRTVNRMGADVIVAPEEYEKSLSDSLFSGELCDFSFDRAWLDKIISMSGIVQATPQRYIATLSASCCSAALQIIAFDPETDFIVQPWIEGLGKSGLDSGEVLVGGNVSVGAGDTIKFFGVDFTVAGKLAKTGTSYDTCVFMSFDTANLLCQSERGREVIGLEDTSSAVSTLMIRTDGQSDSDSVARKINYSLDNAPVKAYTANGMSETVSGTLRQMKYYSVFLIIFLFVMASLALLCVFSITINERRKEFGILRALGAERKQIRLIILTEAGIVGATGGLAGVAAAGAALFAFGNNLAKKLGASGLITDTGSMILLIAECVAAAAALSVLSALFASGNVNMEEPYYLTREEEA